jgi:hypothetical protein
VELVAADEFGPTGSGFNREGVRYRAHFEVNIEVRDMIDSRRDVPREVPVQENPFERDVGSSGHRVWQGYNELVRVATFRVGVHCAALVTAKATMLIGIVGKLCNALEVQTTPIAAGAPRLSSSA